jgi:Tfp pilus assembly protein PilF
MINLVLLLFPGVLVILALWFRQLKRLILNPTATFLGLLSVGSLAFLVAVDPTLGMARDWDLMSLTLLPPVLLLLHQIDRGSSWLAGRTILVYALVCICITGSFLAAATVEGPSADRFYSLLRYYGGKSRGGWATFAHYYKDKGNHERYEEIVKEMDGLFPKHRKLRQAYSYLENRRYGKALKLAQELVDQDPYEPDFLQILGNVYGQLGKYDLAEKYYGQAIKLKPHHAILNELAQLSMKQQKYQKALSTFKRAHSRAPTETPIIEGLGLAYIWLGHLDSAATVADTLFLRDKHSPGGHLMRMVIALRHGNSGKAKHHFQEYLKHGSNRSDYDNISKYYSYLLEH